MAFLTDIEIAQGCRMQPIERIAAKAHIEEKYLENYGRYKAKVDLSYLRESCRENGKLILVTALLQLYFDFYLHGISFSIPLLSVCMCP